MTESEDKCSKCSGRGEFTSIDFCGCCTTDHICDCSAGDAKREQRNHRQELYKKFSVTHDEALIQAMEEILSKYLVNPMSPDTNRVSISRVDLLKCKFHLSEYQSHLGPMDATEDEEIDELKSSIQQALSSQEAEEK